MKFESVDDWKGTFLCISIYRCGFHWICDELDLLITLRAGQSGAHGPKLACHMVQFGPTDYES